MQVEQCGRGFTRARRPWRGANVDAAKAVGKLVAQRAVGEDHPRGGAELRVQVPVVNVPFRLIFAYNPQREGVLDNSFREQQKFSFRFAVGSTF